MAWESPVSKAPKLAWHPQEHTHPLAPLCTGIPIPWPKVGDSHPGQGREGDPVLEASVLRAGGTGPMHTLPTRLKPVSLATVPKLARR